MVRAADCVPVLLADARRRRRSAPPTAGRPGLVAGVVPATVAAMRDLGADAAHRLGRAARVRALLRGARSRCRTRSAAVEPGSRADDLVGHAGARHRRRRARPARRATASRCVDLSRLHARVAPTCYSYRRDGAAVRPPGRHGPDRRPMTDEPPRRDRRRPRRRTTPDRRGLRPAPAATPDEVTLVVVTKFFPASDVRLLADLGVTDVGENRHQEAEDKAAECADLGLRWHFIGGLQSNKAAAVGVLRRRRRVGRPGQAGRTALSAGAHERGHERRRAAPGQPRPARRTRAGRAPTPPTWPPWPPAVDDAGRLRLRGLMAVAPLGEDPVAAFARLAEIRARLRAPAPRRHLALGRA